MTKSPVGFSGLNGLISEKLKTFLARTLGENKNKCIVEDKLISSGTNQVRLGPACHPAGSSFLSCHGLLHVPLLKSASPKERPADALRSPSAEAPCAI